MTHFVQEDLATIKSKLETFFLRDIFLFRKFKETGGDLLDPTLLKVCSGGSPEEGGRIMGR
jgi:hypothetical protein